MDRFCDEMIGLGYRCVYVNKKGDQQNKQINCGLRSLPWLLFVQRYGIYIKRKISKLTYEHFDTINSCKTLKTF